MRARRRYPSDPSRPDPAPQPVVAAPPDAVPGVSPPVAKWRKSVGRTLRQFLPNGPPGDTEVWIDRWIADGCDLRCDVLPAISLACRPSPDGETPAGLAAVGACAEASRIRRPACAAAAA